ncbi:MAG: TlpA family protein disulfide reductase, partial [Deltaproteobacteria bacterium]|nr:TlpA family protein disulfide reductase [Deltaproteobacteria bacterium]
MKKSGVRSQKPEARNQKQEARKKSCILHLASCILLLFTILTGCSSGPQDKQPTAKIGMPAPMFTLNLISGGSITLDSFKGKPLVITFMASWCPCSNESAPVFKEAYSKYNPKGVEFLMIGIQDSESKFKKFIE